MGTKGADATDCRTFCCRAYFYCCHSYTYIYFVFADWTGILDYPAPADWTSLFDYIGLFNRSRMWKHRKVQNGRSPTAESYLGVYLMGEMRRISF